MGIMERKGINKMLLLGKETGLALQYWRLRNVYRQKHCKNRICKFCDVSCSFPSFENWLKNYRRNNV